MHSNGSRHIVARVRARPADLRQPAAVMVLVLLLFLFLASVGAATTTSERPVSAVALFPVENLTADVVPADDIRQFLTETLTAEGITVLEPEALEAFMARHRVRYGGGIDAGTAELLRQETGVEAVVIASVELSSTVVPPKVALFVRLVSITDVPVVAWAEDAGLSGDDAPGLFDLGLVDDYEVLLTRALERVGASLVSYLRTGSGTSGSRPESKFRPKSSYRGLTLAPGRSYSIAVVPFFNLSQRRNAGEIMALLFSRHLSSVGQLRVLDTGVARRQLLNARVIMDGGLSVTDADTVAKLIDADFVLAGRVISYDDYDGAGGLTSVEFSAVLIERDSRRVVWSSHSYNQGTDGVRFFGRGHSRTAHAMATQMVGLTTEAIAAPDR